MSNFKKVLEILTEEKSPMYKKLLLDEPNAVKYNYAILTTNGDLVEFVSNYDVGFERIKKLEKMRKQNLILFNIANDEISDT